MRHPLALRATGPARALGAGLCLALATACGGLLDPDGEGRTEIRRPATLAHYGDTTRLWLPDSVAVGSRLELGFLTFSGGCVGPAGTDVVVRGLDAEVRPWTTEARGRTVVCPDMLVVERHDVAIVFATRGRATVRLHGWRQPGDEAMVVTRTLRVHPSAP